MSETPDFNLRPSVEKRLPRIHERSEGKKKEELPFKCVVCKDSFTEQRYLTNHAKTHDKELEKQLETLNESDVVLLNLPIIGRHFPLKDNNIEVLPLSGNVPDGFTIIPGSIKIANRLMTHPKTGKDVEFYTAICVRSDKV